MTETAFDPTLTTPASRSPGMRRRSLRVAIRAVVAAAIAIAAVATPILGYAGVLKLTGNIDTVEAGAVYRSGQLSGDRLGRLIAEKNIRTVINLRGAHPGTPWYDAEMRATAAANAAHVDLAMSATHEPDAALLAQLIATLKTAQKPLLIHCESGSDRTGLAAALYRLIALAEPPDEAAGQLSFYWGHFPWLGSATIAMDRTFDRVVATQPERRR